MTIETSPPMFLDGAPRIAYRRQGSGPAVVFLHGIGGNSLNWRGQCDTLSDRYATVAWDARGYGFSDDYEGDLSFGSFADDLIRLLDGLDLAQAHLVGLSMGARILMDFQARYPGRAATLTLCDCHFGFQTALTPEKRAEFIRLRQQPLQEGKSLADLAPTLIDSLVGPNCTETAQADLLESILALHVDSYLKTIAASTNFDCSNDLSDFDLPVNLIYGEYDRLTPPSIGEDIAGRISSATLRILPDAGHLSNLEQPKAFNAALENFLDQHHHLANQLERS
jgi:3-oxoadipate enol-lactonase